MTPVSAYSDFLALFPELVRGAVAAPETEAFDIIRIQQTAVVKAKKKHRLLLRMENFERVLVVIIASLVPAVYRCFYLVSFSCLMLCSAVVKDNKYFDGSVDTKSKNLSSQVD
jgi:hypothetical protein